GVLPADILAEDQIGVGSAMQPTIVLDLVLQLARSPAGIAECEDRALRSLPARDRLENVEGSGEANALVDRQGRILDEEVARVQHEPALGVDRATLEHLHALCAWWKSDQVGRRNDVELHQKIGKADMRCRLIDDDAHGAFGRVGADVDHAAREAFVAHGWHRDQHLAVEKAALQTLAALPWPRRLRRDRPAAHIGLFNLRTRLVAGPHCSALTRHVRLTSKFHGKMLPDWPTIANEAPR